MHTLSKPTLYTLQDRDILMGEAVSHRPYVLRVRDLPLNDKPREKLLSFGPANLTQVELMAILLSVGTRKEEVMNMAHRIVREYGERAIMNEKDPARLAETLQIPLVKACQIVASFELGRRSYQSRAGRPVAVHSAQQAYEYLKGMAHLPKEQLRGLYLNSRHQVIYEEIISIGTVTANIVHPREVFRPAIEYNAVALVIAHNHPSGVLEATREDIEATRQLIIAGEVLGVDLLDHLIIADDSFISLISEAERSNAE